MKTFPQGKIIDNLNQLREYEGNNKIVTQGFCHGDSVLWGLNHLLGIPIRMMLRHAIGKIDTFEVPTLGFEHEQMLIVSKLLKERLQKKQPKWSASRVNKVVKAYLFDFIPLSKTQNPKSFMLGGSGIVFGKALCFEYLSYVLTQQVVQDILSNYFPDITERLKSIVPELIEKIENNLTLSNQEARDLAHILISSHYNVRFQKKIISELFDRDGLIGERVRIDELESLSRDDVKILSRDIQNALVSQGKKDIAKSRTLISLKVLNKIIQINQSFDFVNQMKVFFSETIGAQIPDVLFKDLGQCDEAKAYNRIHLQGDTQVPGLREEFNFSSILARDELEYVIEKVTFNKANKFFLLLGEDHTITLHRENDFYTLFDPSSHMKPLQSNDLTVIAKLIIRNLNLSYSGKLDSKTIHNKFIKIKGMGLTTDAPGVFVSNKQLQKDLLKKRIENKKTKNPLEITSWEGFTPVIAALYGNDLESFEFLVSHGANLKVKSSHTTLEGVSDSLKLIDIVFRIDVYLDVKNYERIYKILCVTQEEKQEAFNLAIKFPQKNCLKMFLKKGYPLDTLGESDEPLLFSFARVCDPQMFFEEIDKLDIKERIRLVRELKFKENGSRLIHFIAQSRNYPLLKAVLKKWPDLIHQVNDDGFSALHFASGSNRNESETLETITLLVESGIDIDSQDKQGYTALMEAAEAGEKDAFYMLWTFGAKVAVQNKNFESILDLAIKNDNYNIVHCIIKNNMFGKNTMPLALSKCVLCDKKELICQLVLNQVENQQKVFKMVCQELTQHKKWNMLFDFFEFFNQTSLLKLVPIDLIDLLANKQKNNTHTEILREILLKKNESVLSDRFQSVVTFVPNEENEKSKEIMVPKKITDSSSGEQIQKYFETHPDEIQKLSNAELEDIISNLDENEEYECIFYLLNKSERIDLKKQCDTYPDILARAIYNGHVPLVKKMVNAGANGDSWMVDDKMHLCAVNMVARGDLEIPREHQIELIKDLLSLGAGINSSDYFGPMIHEFSKRGDLKALKFLKDNGADFNVLCLGDSALQVAMNSRDRKIGKFFVENKLTNEVGEWLSQIDPPKLRMISHSVKGSLDAFSLACINGQLEVVEHLLNNQPEIFINSKTNESNGLLIEGLYLAIEFYRDDIAKKIIEHPLSQHGFQNEHVLKAKAFSNMTHREQTPMGLAYLRGNKELLEYGFSQQFDIVWSNQKNSFAVIPIIISMNDAIDLKKLVDVNPKILSKKIEGLTNEYNFTRFILETKSIKLIKMLIDIAEQDQFFKGFFLSEVINNFSKFDNLSNEVVKFCLANSDMMLTKNKNTHPKIIHDLNVCIKENNTNGVKLVLGIKNLDHESLLMKNCSSKSYGNYPPLLKVILESKNKSLIRFVLLHFSDQIKRAREVLENYPLEVIYKMDDPKLLKDFIYADPEAFFIRTPHMFINKLYLSNSKQLVQTICDIANYNDKLRKELITSLLEFVPRFPYNVLVSTVLEKYTKIWSFNLEQNGIIKRLTTLLNDLYEKQSNEWFSKIFQLGYDVFEDKFIHELKSHPNKKLVAHIEQLRPKEDKPRIQPKSYLKSRK